MQYLIPQDLSLQRQTLCTPEIGSMSFLGRFKKPLGVPPAPPRRVDTSSDKGWPADEFDDDDGGDTYEAPPCERMKLPPPRKQEEEDLYLERTSSNPGNPPPQIPPPRPVKNSRWVPKIEEQYLNPSAKKPPQINREAKPGNGMKAPPPKRDPAPGRLPPRRPAPAAQPEEDVYLDPNEGQGDGDEELYLEPNTACPPSPRNAAKLGVPPPSPGPCSYRNPLLCLTVPALLFSAANPTPVRSSLSSGPEGCDWFAGSCDRKMAESLLYRINKDGSFLVRLSSAQGSKQPYTLVVLYKHKVYNIPVRYLETSRQYALGKEGKTSEELFSSLCDIIDHHRKNPLLLIDSKSNAKYSSFLTHAARP
ncbi:B-cell linker protein [Acipenser oxyrinchus oxyrinchus]|uniref:B-cell linker protein n=1 Tax=Acipenser oxyrinchus oxyrinchus TaxID=40147 RepID=A0AAD8CPN2_ACIOX|nr:B-cell linker protein [Acipenser oxyrinchus oxyrinchus]